MVTQQAEFQRSDLRLGEEFENGYMAIGYSKDIKESGRLLIATLGDVLELREARQVRESQEIAIQPTRLSDGLGDGPGDGPGDGLGDGPGWSNSQARDSSITTSLKSLINTVDTVLVWLEHSGKTKVQNFMKQEAVLRGIFHLTDLGNMQARLFALLEFTSDFLDIPEEPFQAQRDFIVNTQKDIEDQKEHILQLVNEAGEVLKAIINDEHLDRRKGVQFDNIVRQADVEIRCCRRRLESVKEKVNELSTKMTTLKWSSRAVRLAGLAITGYFLHQKYKEGTFGLPILALSSSAAAVAWISLFPSRAYEFHESLCVLASNHSVLTERLVDLREKLHDAKDFKDGLTKDSQGDAV